MRVHGARGGDPIASRRIDTLLRLQASIARNGSEKPVMSAADRPAVATFSGSKTVTATGNVEYYPTDAQPLGVGRYSSYGGDYFKAGTTFPRNLQIEGVTGHRGNGTDPLANPEGFGAVHRFSTTSPKLDIISQSSSAGNKMRVAVDIGDGNGLQWITPDATTFDGGGDFFGYWPITWGTGSDADRKLRHYQVEYGAGGRFAGIVTLSKDRPAPWPDPLGLRGGMFTDSMGTTIADTLPTDGAASRPEYSLQVRDRLGFVDWWALGVGATGYGNNLNGTLSYFIDRARVDVIGKGFDVLCMTGGLNDNSNVEAAATTMFGEIIADNPAIAMFVTGPTKLADPAQKEIDRRNELAAASAKFPRNIAFLDNIGEQWAHGTGRVGALANNGNADILRGTDGTHWSRPGGGYYGDRLVRAIANAIPALLARQ